MRRSATALAAVLTLASTVGLAACSGADDATVDSSQTTAAAVSAPTSEAAATTAAASADLSNLSGSCQGASDAAGPIKFTDASIRTEGDLLVVSASLADNASETTYPTAVFTATLVGPSGGIIQAGLKPGNGGSQAVYTFDMETAQNTYQNGSYTFADGQVAYRVPLSAFDRLGGVSGWAFSIENNGTESDACGSALNPIAVD